MVMFERERRLGVKSVSARVAVKAALCKGAGGESRDSGIGMYKCCGWRALLAFARAASSSGELHEYITFHYFTIQYVESL